MSVLLPPAQDGKLLLIGGAKALYSGNSFDRLATGSEPKAAEILDTKAATSAWTRLPDMAFPRINATTVLLPDGKVLVLGGHDLHKFESTHTPSNQAEIYDPALNTWVTAAAMSASRMYHSVALLLADGRVWTGGGYDPNAGGDQKNMQIYKPPCFFNGTQPTITSVTNDDGPAGQICYGRTLRISTPDASQIRKVVIIRPGAITHHTDSEQRYVPLSFVQSGSSELKAAVVSDPTVAPPGYYTVWIVDDQNRPCQEASFVRLTPQQCRVVTDRSTFSKDEVAPSGTTAFPGSFYVMMDGFLPSELGITTSTPTATQLASLAPAVAFLRADGTTYSSIGSTPETLLAEDPSLPAGKRQRFTFRFSVAISGTGDFFQPDGTTPIETQAVRIAANKLGYSCEGRATLTHQPNPYLLDGATHWLSVNLRVFQSTEGETRFGRNVGASDASALTFLQNVLSDWNTNPATGASQFAGLSGDQQASRLELSRSVGGKRVFNFALAQVRYRGRTLPAADVRVFFRAFTTAATGLQYNEAGAYRRLTNVSGDPEAALGVVGGEIATIPFFAEPRVNTAVTSMTQQRDTHNVRTIAATGGSESATFLGCWLDFNQTSLRFPDNPSGNGPWSTGLKSIQQLIRGAHQCLVAEVFFAPDPIPANATPAANDNLAQRNLAIIESDNPGGIATRTIQHTLMIKPSEDHMIKVPATPTVGGDIEFQVKVPQLLVGDGLDELMIEWDLPSDTRATIYLPDIDIEELLSLNQRRASPAGIQDVGDHTVELPVGEVTYLPLPRGRTANIPALLTVRLPEASRRGKRYKVLVRQIDGIFHRVLGTVEFFIPIVTKPEVLDREARRLAVFRHIAEHLPTGDRWQPIFGRMLEQLADRVDGLGGNSAEVEPSPDGADVLVRESATRTCFCLLGLAIGLAALVGALLGLLSRARNRNDKD